MTVNCSSDSAFKDPLSEQEAFEWVNIWSQSKFCLGILHCLDTLGPIQYGAMFVCNRASKFLGLSDNITCLKDEGYVDDEPLMIPLGTLIPAFVR